MVEVFAFACRHKDRPEWQETIYNAQNAGKARYQFWLDVTEPYPDTKLIDLRVRKLGKPRANEMFRHVARSRGMPDLEPGERIMSAHGDGVIVDAGGGACFTVIFDTGKWAGQRLSIHPSEFTRCSTVGKSGDGK